MLIALVIGATVPVSHGRQPAACSEPLHAVMRTTEVYSFDAIEVISRDDAWTTGEAEGTYLSNWDGTSWERVAAPESRHEYLLRALSASAADEVWAVGFRLADRTRAMALQWDGSAWNKVALPEVGRESWLLDVAALPGGEVFAVGGFRQRHGKGRRVLILRFDGTQWARERPSFGRGRYQVGDIAGGAPENLWAIPIGRGWVMRRDAGVWVRVRLPEHLRPLRKTLEDVDVTPSGTAWVVGGIDRRGSKALVLEHGPTGWREHPTPSRRYPENLSAVDVSGEDQVAGAGYRIYGDHAYPYAVRLTSASFEYVPADNPGWLAFWDVALDQTGGAWAVGEYATDRSDGGIIERAC